jgi:hypothetical protein
MLVENIQKSPGSACAIGILKIGPTLASAGCAKARPQDAARRSNLLDSDGPPPQVRRTQTINRPK